MRWREITEGISKDEELRSLLFSTLLSLHSKGISKIKIGMLMKQLMNEPSLMGSFIDHDTITNIISNDPNNRFAQLLDPTEPIKPDIDTPGEPMTLFFNSYATYGKDKDPNTISDKDQKDKEEGKKHIDDMASKQLQKEKNQ